MNPKFTDLLDAHKLEASPCLSRTSFEMAVENLAAMKGDAIPVILLVVPAEMQFDAARLVKHYEDLIQTRAFLKGTFLPPMISLAIDYSMHRTRWMVIHNEFIVWSPGC